MKNVNEIFNFTLMKPIYTLLLCLILASCAKRDYVRLSPAQMQNDTLYTTAPMDTLAAYRKRPGKPKTVQVKGYYKKDSTYVKPHARTPRE